ncbi:Acyltransferase family protein [Tritrichomonas foetus]|uniref:Acyltransferase family protein n=1 Tax=Tritrichomonas foetus TaxID=1144522 RepID=A0A1J4JWH1_9EUKA|nr:Acyltransferase family protein [Tritrichomonas foetus]|eukprot:OHT01637.1 Acyltransferase family protein [Tritrichomonas foetus]
MPLYTSIPIDLPEYHNQTKRIEPTHEQFLSLFDEAKPSTIIKIYRFITFIVFMFPIKIIFMLFGIVYFSLTIQILGHIAPYIKNKSRFRNVSFYITWPGVRSALLGAGIVWISRTGTLRPNTRTMVSNHLSISDCIVLMTQFPLCILAMKGLASSSFIQAITHVFELIFVDRTQFGCHISHEIVKTQEDKSHLPLMIFPEGKITNGTGLVGFRSGAFVSDEQVQAVAIRYNMWLTTRDMATIAWLEPNMKLFIYQLLAIPFTTVNVDVLEPLDLREEKLTPKQKAEKVELQMANFFGCPAYRKTNKSIFKGKITVN